MQTLGTGGLSLAVCFGLPTLQGWLWRRTILEERGEVMAHLQRQGVTVVRVWMGFELRSMGTRVALVGGLSGLRTRLCVSGAPRQLKQGLLSPSELCQIFSVEP